MALEYAFVAKRFSTKHAVVKLLLRLPLPGTRIVTKSSIQIKSFIILAVLRQSV